jgi:hypothetical protein
VVLKEGDPHQREDVAVLLLLALELEHVVIGQRGRPGYSGTPRPEA